MSVGAVPLCRNCGRPGWHYVAPRLGNPGYYACPEPDPVPDPAQPQTEGGERDG